MRRRVVFYSFRLLRHLSFLVMLGKIVGGEGSFSEENFFRLRTQEFRSDLSSFLWLLAYFLAWLFLQGPRLLLDLADQRVYQVLLDLKWLAQILSQRLDL